MRGAAVLIAFDFGQRRIGIATGNLLTRTASPLTTVNVGAQLPWPEIDRIIAEWRPQHLVVGQPSSKGALASRVARFVDALEQRYGLDVATVDETLTSHAAHAELRDARRAGHLRRRLDRKAELDRHAACLIAEQWLNEHEESDE
ncbi:MAG TPA: Holliday junction resolvase RuvX [Gammaproteobacteria bacterium]